MKLLITGAGGMLGMDLCRQLRDSFNTVGLGRKKRPDFPVPYRIQDLCDPKATASLFYDEKPDIVFHAAAMTAVDDCETRRENALKDNVEATKNVVEAANRCHAFLVFFSTDYVYDGAKMGEYEESDCPRPLNYYGETKLLAERYIQDRAEKFSIFRTSWLYGCHGKSFPRTILQKARETSHLKVVADQVGRPTYTRDLAAIFSGLLKENPEALDKAQGEIIHIANEGAASWADFAKKTLEAGQRPAVKVECITTDELKRPARRPANSVLCLHKLKSLLGVCPRPWPEALPDFIEEVRENENLKQYE